MQIIWYNADQGKYKYGNPEQLKEDENKAGQEIDILYELDCESSLLALKIVSELNKARKLEEVA